MLNTESADPAETAEARRPPSSENRRTFVSTRGGYIGSNSPAGGASLSTELTLDIARTDLFLDVALPGCRNVVDAASKSGAVFFAH